MKGAHHFLDLWKQLPSNVRPMRWVLTERQWVEIQWDWRLATGEDPPSADEALIMGLPIRVRR
jgi:hypothetical protein